MSYKSDMKKFQDQANERKQTLVFLLKITTILLALSIVIGGIGLGITLATGAVSSPKKEKEKPTNDHTAPVIVGPKDNIVVVYIGQTVSYKSFVTVRDDSAYTLNVNNSDVKLDTEGSYIVSYRAVDEAGNKSEIYTLTLIVRQTTVTEADVQKLYADIAAKANALGITKTLSKEEQVRKIYNFVNGHIHWGSDQSNIAETHGTSFTRLTWESDWQEEAILALKNGEGDCYSYYALSKAFFEYFGIENLGIQRSSRSNEPGTHFWNIVNIGTESDPQWYYYDATELAGTFKDGTDNGCLMTEAKLQSYVTSKGGREFYLFDKWDGFPTISTKVIG